MALAAAAVLVDILVLAMPLRYLAAFGAGAERAAQDARWAVPAWQGAGDGSVLELVGQLQLGAGAVLLLLVALRSPSHRVLGVWGGAFPVMAADDLLTIHEHAGRVLGDLGPESSRSTPAGAQELGGLGFWTVAGVLFGAALIRAHRSSSAPARRASWTLLAVVAPLGTVGVLYVLLSAFLPEQLDTAAGTALVAVRIATKLATMTLVLIQALRIREARR